MKPRSTKIAKTSRENTRETKRYPTRSGSLGRGLYQTPWYDVPEEDAYERIFQHVRSVKNHQIRRRYQLAIFQQYYNNNLSSVWAPSSMFSATAANTMGAYNRLSTNVIKSCCDTATAMVAKTKPRAFVLPNKGDYRLKKKARNMTKFLDGSMKASGFFAQSEDAFRDCTLYGDGNIIVMDEDDEVRSIAAKVDEIIIDAVDGMFGDPQEVHWEHPEPRAKMLKRFPKFAKQINDAKMSWRGDMSFMSERDLVLVVYTWRKPSLRGGDDGRQIVSICNATLKDKPWTRDYLPVFRIHWTPPTYGPFGTGIAQDLEGKQWMITNIMRDVGESIHKFAVPRVWVESTSGVSQHNITNELSVNKYTGTPPVFSTPTAMAPDVYQYLQWLIDQCFKEEGLSQLSAQSEKPAGLNAAVALRAYQDVQTQRFALVGQRWERLYMAAAECHIDTAQEIYDRKGKLSVKVEGRGFIETVDWKDANLKRDMYDMAVWPTSILPETPEGKLQMAQEYMNSGFMPKDVAMSQLRMPILNDWIDQETAPRDNIERCLSSILDRAKFIDPEPVGNIDLCVQMAQNAVLVAQDEDVEPHKVELLQRFLNRSLELQAAAKQTENPPTPEAATPGAPVAGRAPQPAAATLAPAGAGPVAVPTAA